MMLPSPLHQGFSLVPTAWRILKHRRENTTTNPVSKLSCLASHVKKHECLEHHHRSISEHSLRPSSPSSLSCIHSVSLKKRSAMLCAKAGSTMRNLQRSVRTSLREDAVKALHVKQECRCVHMVRSEIFNVIEFSRKRERGRCFRLHCTKFSVTPIITPTQNHRRKNSIH